MCFLVVTHLHVVAESLGGSQVKKVGPAIRVSIGFQPGCVVVKRRLEYLADETAQVPLSENAAETDWTC